MSAQLADRERSLVVAARLGHALSENEEVLYNELDEMSAVVDRQMAELASVQQRLDEEVARNAQLQSQLELAQSVRLSGNCGL